MGTAGGQSSVDRRGDESPRRKPRTSFVKWVAACAIVAAIAGGIFGVTRLLAAIAGEPSVAGIPPYTVTGVWAGVIAVPYLAVLWALCGVALALILYLIYFSVDWVFRTLRGPVANADELREEGSRRPGE